jgi:predicted DNA-binding protein with PD1-like motif
MAVVEQMRLIEQPGPPVAERIQWVEARGRAFSFTLEAGVPLLEAARRGFAKAGFAGGVLNMRGGALGPFAYVMPALSKTPKHAAFYSDTFRPDGITRLRIGAMTLGERGGAPFFHCHALWREADGRLNGGHVLPEETIVAEPFEADAYGIDGAIFMAEPDPETNFKLFGPVAKAFSSESLPRTSSGLGTGSRKENASKTISNATGVKNTGRAFALRLRPNQDFAGALEAFCRERGILRARLHGGVGSIIGARFADGRSLKPFATELAVGTGVIAPGPDGALEAQLDIALVDYLGGLGEGRLARGDNPVLMTMELVLEVPDEGTKL